MLNVCAVPKLPKAVFNTLLNSGADIKGVDEHGQNALFKAAETGNLVLLRALLAHGVSPMQRDETGEIPLSVALRCGNAIVADFLMEVTENPAKVIDRQGCNLLHKAAWGDVFSVARRLVQIHEIQVGSQDANGHTALHIAAYHGSGKMLKYLTEELNANVNAIDKEGRTPIFSGAYDSNLRTLKFLCKLGADLTWKDNQWMTVLQFASMRKEFEAEKLLKSNVGLYPPRYPDIFVTAKPEQCPVCVDSSKHISCGCCSTENSLSFTCIECLAQFIMQEGEWKKIKKQSITSLSAQDERRYSRWLLCKDEEKRHIAKQCLIHANLWKVIQLALPYRETCPEISSENLLKFGIFGLLWVFDTFVNYKNLRFSHCAEWGINQYIKRGIIGIMRKKAESQTAGNRLSISIKKK